jgi:hypothetical protein
MPATTTEALLDVNVLIAAVFADHPSHPTALQFVQQLNHFYTSPTTQGWFSAFCDAAVEGHTSSPISSASGYGIRPRHPAKAHCATGPRLYPRRHCVHQFDGPAAGASAMDGRISSTLSWPTRRALSYLRYSNSEHGRRDRSNCASCGVTSSESVRKFPIARQG